MDTENADEFPRREFRESKAPYQACVNVASMILPSIVVATTGKILPDFPAKITLGVIAWCLIAVACFVVMRRALSRMDFNKPIVILDANAVTFLQSRTKVVSWSAVYKVRFRESGQYRATKTFVFQMANGGEIEFVPSSIAGISARQLFDLIRIYHRKFGPLVTVVPGYDSSDWTGNDDD